MILLSEDRRNNRPVFLNKYLKKTIYTIYISYISYMPFRIIILFTIIFNVNYSSLNVTSKIDHYYFYNFFFITNSIYGLPTIKFIPIISFRTLCTISLEREKLDTKFYCEKGNTIIFS